MLASNIDHKSPYIPPISPFSMFNASGDLFQSLKSDLSSSLLSLQRTNHRVNLYSSALILCLQALCLVLPWYSKSVLAKNDYDYVFLFGVCRKNWDNYCKAYQTLIGNCGNTPGGDCGEYRENWEAGKITAGMLVVSVAAMTVVVIYGLVSQREIVRFSLIPLPFQLASFLCSSTGAVVWLSLSHYERATVTEAQPGMTLALVSVILCAALVVHTGELRVETKEFRGISGERTENSGRDDG